jgi:hypothetical protein
MNGTVDRPVEWAIVVLNRGWGASSLLPEARRRADAGEAAAMLVTSWLSVATSAPAGHRVRRRAISVHDAPPSRERRMAPPSRAA